MNDVNFSQINSLFKNINNSIINLKNNQSDTIIQKTLLRNNEQDAKIDYALQYNGNGFYKINKEKLNQIKINEQEIVQKAINLKIKDCLQGFLGEFK